MGMAASQARLLCLTARQHDVEFQAQAIQNAKLQLATQSDQVYEEYLAALDANSLVISASNNGTNSNIVANFNNLCSSNKVIPADGSNYILRTKNGKLVVEDFIEEGYDDYKNSVNTDHNAYHFALYMLNGGEEFPTNNGTDNEILDALRDAELKIIIQYCNENDDPRLLDLYNNVIKLRYPGSEDGNNNDDSDNISYYDEDGDLITTGLEDTFHDADVNANGSTDDKKAYNDAVTALMDYLYNNYANEIFNTAKGNNDPNDDSYVDIEEDPKFNYYVNIFNCIESCGGCVSIDEYNGPNGDAASNSEWLQNMILSGQFIIQTITDDKNEPNKLKFDTVSPNSSISLSYMPTSSIDSTAEKKAEAEYEHKMKQINQKDKKFDLDLSKLETERSAIKTELDNIKKVIDDNIKKTFGIFG